MMSMIRNGNGFELHFVEAWNWGNAHVGMVDRGSLFDFGRSSESYRSIMGFV